MTTTNRLLSMACAALLTMTILLGIDHLAQTGAPQADVPQMALTPSARG
jgi:hypothetical protein